MSLRISALKGTILDDFRQHVGKINRYRFLSISAVLNSALRPTYYISSWMLLTRLCLCFNDRHVTSANFKIQSVATSLSDSRKSHQKPPKCLLYFQENLAPF
jgi:hypothetical protein